MIKYKKGDTMDKEKDIILDDDTCDLDPRKICDSCGKCIEPDKNYEIIKITKIIE